MNKEDFQKLIEIQSLDLTIKKHLDNIKNEEKRLELLNTQKERKFSAISFCEKCIQKNKKSLFEAEKMLEDNIKSLESLQSKTASLSTQSQIENAEKQIASLEEVIPTLEEKVFELMSSIEEDAIQIQENKNFLEGFEKTFYEIESEVSEIKKDEQKEIKNLEDRINFLVEDCPDNFKNLFAITNKKYRHNSPLAFIKDGRCHMCHLGLSKNDQNQIELMVSLEVCSNCKRIMIPLSARA